MMAWQLHRDLMLFAAALALGGLGVIIAFTEQQGSEHFVSTHQLHGLVLTVLMVLQPLIGFLRPNKPEKPAHCTTTRAHAVRTTWRVLHTACGVGLLVWSIFQLNSGIRWFGEDWITYVVIGGWALAGVAAAVGLMLSLRGSRKATTT
mgnify:CR=1 FL=1